ncbi:MAG: hypothetical protein LQ352_003346 [Teloschistes flavicans]|nr:MAG: hypothetical protein LQ352_003346 [Teloschistes flavicans]
MAEETRVFVFGDQTCNVNAKLRQLLLLQGNPILTTFFEQAFYVIRTELGHLPVAEQKTFPRFNSIADLLSRQRKDGVNQALQTALSCIYQLGWFIDQYGQVGRSYPDQSDTYLLGLCTGALSAAAIGCSKTLSELLPAAVQTVAVAFRLGLFVMRFRDGIEQSSGKAPVWSVLFPGLSAEKAEGELENFIKVNPWISAYAPNAVTLSGPPSILKRLRETTIFAQARSKDLPIHVASHASHLFTSDDIDWILEKTSTTAWASYNAKIPTFSAGSGKLVWAGSLRSLLHVSLHDVLCEPIRLDKVLQEISLRVQQVTRVKITAVATNVEGMLCTAIKDLQATNSHHSNSSDTVPSAIIDNMDQKPSEAKVPCGKSKLAIVGMSGRFPEAESPEEFWDLLYQGLDVVKEVPLKRWDVKTHVDPTCSKKGTGATPWGCWLKNPGLFDARFFAISPKEAPQMDPSQRLSLMVTYEAMENSGIVPGTTPSTMTDRIGVFHGATGMDWAETNASQDIDTYYIPGGIRAFIAGRINFCFEFCGPSYTNDTACSSALAAIHLACNSLWRHDVDTAIASASNSISNPDGHAGLDRGFFLSRTGNCKTFDDEADGYCRSEGVGTVIIKRLEDAIADNDPILAVILDAKTNHSALSESMTRPYGPAQKANMDMVLSETGVSPAEISYIEMHGTGTQVGDAIEMDSVLDIFAPKVGLRGRSEEESLYLGSAKANVGHSEGSSGMMSMAKILLMMRNNTIVPHCGIKPGHKINRNYPTDLAERGIRIAQKPVPWHRPQGGKRKVLINNFSAPGGNTAVILEDAPIRVEGEAIEADPRSTHLVTVSAKCAASLKGNMESLIKYLGTANDENLNAARLGYTSTARRLHHLHRVVVSGSSVSEIEVQLTEALSRGDGMNRPKSKPQLVLAFTGQGSQYLGMGKQLYEAFSDFRKNIQRFDQLARKQGFPSFQHIITTADGNIDEFTPVVVQLATTCMQMALARLWLSWGIVPQAVVGHSLGEYAALNIAGVLSEADTIYLVGKRAILLQEDCQRGTHAMLAVKASVSTIGGFLGDQKFEVACINGPDDTVLGGSVAHINKIKTALANHQLKTKILEIPYAFHTSQVDPILDQFETIATGVSFHKPTVPVLSPLLGKPVAEEGCIGPKYLAMHCRQTVNMRDALQNGSVAKLIGDKSCVIEVGPQPVVSGMVRATLGPQIKSFPSLQRKQDTWTLLTSVLTYLYTNGLDIKWCEWHRDFKASHKVLPLPAYSWDLKEYWIPYVGDWCLRRGEILPDANTGLIPAVASASSKVTSAVLPKVETTAVHRLVAETEQDQKQTLIFESDFSREDLNGIAKGHQVNGIPLTTPSVYAEMALTIGKYLLDRYKPEMTERLVDVSNMLVEKALIPHSQGPQLLRTSAKVDWANKNAACVFYSVNENGKTTMEHAWCTLKFTDRAQLPKVQGQAADYLARIASLRNGIMAGDSMRYSQTAGYKLIATLAKFHPDYRAIDEVVLDSKTLEAYSTVSFGQVKKGGTFQCHPAYIDVLSQTAGFIMNGKDSTDLDVEIYVNHGWDSLQIFEELTPDKNYQTYVRMEQAEGSVFKGDTVMFDGDRVVAIFKGLALRGVSRNVFSVILASADRQKPKQTGKAQTFPASKSAALLSAKPSPPKVEQVLQQPTLSTVTKPTTVAALEKAAMIVQNVTKSDPAKKDVVSPALAIISEESGIAMTDLTDDCVFADIGVDSLLSMVITSRFREELGLSLDLESSMFIDFPTVKGLKDYLDPPGQATNSVEVTIEASNDHQAVVSTLVETIETTHNAVEQTVTHTTTEVIVSTTTSNLATSALNIISEESGIALDELTDDTAFADIGVDSLLSMTITSRFREELAIDLELDFSMFVDLPTVAALKSFLSKDEPDEAPSSEISFSTGGISTPEKQDIADAADITSISTISSDSEDGVEPEKKTVDNIVTKTQPPSNTCRPATSVILQGFPRTASKTLFLLPDGGGSSSSYVPIPKLNIANVAIVGLNCPYARDPDSMNVTITALMESYVSEIRRRQKHGPYHLGGWSSGGVFAYLAAQTLLTQGEKVESLVIIDSPVPQLVDRLPRYFYDYCDQIGLFGASTADSAPSWLIPHFEASVDVLIGHQLNPLPKSPKNPKTWLIWACDSVLEGKDAPPIKKDPSAKSKGVHFLLEKRKDFGPNGWEEMVGGECVCERMEGANHFSMMVSRYFPEKSRSNKVQRTDLELQQKQHVAKIGKFIERAMG